MDAVVAVIAIVIGLAIGYLIAHRVAAGDRARLAEVSERATDLQTTLVQRDTQLQETAQEVTRLRTQLEEREKLLQIQLQERERALQLQLEERDRALKAAEELEKRMQQVFAEVAQTVTSRSSEEFLKLAQQRFETLTQESAGQLASREEAIKGLLAPLDTTLKQYRQAVEELDRRRQEDRSTIEERLKSIAEAEAGLKVETMKLVTALRRPEVRGRWGEMSLRNAVELAGMSEYCDFEEQPQVTQEGLTQRPDMTIRMPGGGTIIVDNKVPMDAYLRAMEATDPAMREQLLREHATQCRRHVDSLARKAYWDQFKESPRCVVMFVPMESLYMAALEVDAGLLDCGLQNRVMIATPATLMGLLHTVSYGWQQLRYEEQSAQVYALASQFHDRLVKFAGDFVNVGKSLDGAIKKYNEAVGSLEHSVVVPARKLRDMGVQGKKELPEVNPLETVARQLGPELNPAVPPVPELATGVEDEVLVPEDIVESEVATED